MICPYSCTLVLERSDLHLDTMPRTRLHVDEVLAMIGVTRGRAAQVNAKRLVELAIGLGAQPWPRQQGVALRLPGRVDSKPDWLTLYVVSTAGTVYNHWQDRWEGAGVARTAIEEFERQLTTVFGRGFLSHPSAFRSAADVNQVDTHWRRAERAVRRAVSAIRGAVDDESRRSNGHAAEPHSSAMAALEGQMTETRVSRRGRNGTLRRAALLRANGHCAACGVDFGALLGGRGRRVLQVHHKKQLSDRDEPEWTSVDDLDVVCANCHLLIHADRSAPIPVEALRALLRA